MSSTRRFSSWIGVLVSTGLVLWLLRRFDLNDVIRALASAHYVYFLPAGFFILLSLATRAQRWRSLFTAEQRPDLTSSFVALSIGYLTNNILPARAGEIIRSYVLSRREHLPMSGILATVVVERVVELVVVLLMASALLLFTPLPSWASRSGLILAPAAVLSMALLFMLWKSGERCNDRLLRILSFLPDLVTSKIRSFSTEFVGTIAALSRTNAMLFLLWTVPVWCSEVLILFVLSRAFNLPLTLPHALFVVLVVGLGTSIPSSPGFIGTYEFCFTSSLAAIGIHGGSALSFAIAVHAVTFVGANAFGLASLLLTGISLRQDLTDMQARTEPSSG